MQPALVTSPAFLLNGGILITARKINGPLKKTLYKDVREGDTFIFNNLPGNIYVKFSGNKQGVWNKNNLQLNSDNGLACNDISFKDDNEVTLVDLEINYFERIVS